MIEEFAVPGWVRLMVKMTGRQLRQSTKWEPRRPSAAAHFDPMDKELPAMVAVHGAAPDELAAGDELDRPVVVAAQSVPAEADIGRVTRSFLEAARAMLDESLSSRSAIDPVAVAIPRPQRAIAEAVVVTPAATVAELADTVPEAVKEIAAESTATIDLPKIVAAAEVVTVATDAAFERPREPVAADEQIDMNDTQVVNLISANTAMEAEVVPFAARQEIDGGEPRPSPVAEEISSPIAPAPAESEAAPLVEPAVAASVVEVPVVEPPTAETVAVAPPDVIELPEPVAAPTPAIETPSVAKAPLAPGETPIAAAKPESIVATVAKTTASSVLAPAVRDEYNRTNLDYRRPMPRPKVRGRVIDFHCHLLARRHAEDWFEAADHFGIDGFLTMSPLEECVAMARDWGHRIRFITMPQWGDASPRWVDNWLMRIEGFYNLGSRIAKFHASPGTMIMRGHRLDEPIYRPLFAEVVGRGMAIMTHIGDPDTWYNGRYSDASKFGSREDHRRMWEGLLEAHRGTPWVGAHMGGNPEDLPWLQSLFDRFPDLWLDCSATRWMVREISARRDPAREFFIRNQDRILFGSDQVSGNDRHFDFLASRFWCHRKLWETAYTGPSPIIDPDLPKDEQPVLRGLALPDVVLQKIYRDNATRLLAKIGMSF